MPNLRDIQEFASELSRLGNEPDILRERGEGIEEPPQPFAEEGGADDAFTGLETGPDAQSAAAEAATPSELDEGLPPDIDQLLAGLGEEPAEETPGSEEEIPAGEPGGEEVIGEEPGEDTFLDDFLRESSQAEESELTSIAGEPEAPAHVPSFDEPPGPEVEGPAADRPGPAGQDIEPPGSEEPGFGEPEFEAPGFEEPEPAPAEELPDENLFFDVPSPEELGPPEELGFPAEEEPAGLGVEPEASPGAGEPAEGSPASGGGAPQLDLAELSTGEPPSEEEAEVPGEEAFGAFELPAELAGGAVEAGGGQGAPDEFGLPEGLEFSEEPGSELQQSTEPQGEPDEFSLPEGLELGGEPEAPGGGPLPEEAAGGEEPAGEFELPTFDEEAFDAEPPVPEEALGASEVPGGEPAAADLSVPDEELHSPGEVGEEGIASDLEPPMESMFDESAFELPTEEPLGEPAEEPTGPAGEGVEMAPESAAAAGGGEFDDLGLGDIGEQFGLFGEGEAPPSEEELNPALAVGGAGEQPGPEAPAAAPAPADITISDRDFEHIQRTLSSLPRNLRIAVEELIGEQDLGGRRLSQLVALLVRGAPPHQIADLTSRILGRKIEIPASYEKRTGLQFEEERATFGYRFRHNILPILRVFLAGAAIIALLVFLGYRFVYRPIHAYTLYAQGYGQLQNDNFMTANQDFTAASRQWQMKNWYYRYADGYIGKKQYSFAADKFDALLKVWPGDRKGIFDYSGMESKILGNYAKANSLLNRILNKNQWDYQGLLHAGDNYLRWGRHDPSKLDLARKDFAMLLQHYGSSNPVLFKMLRYFILTDNLKQVEILKNQFQAEPHIKVDPLAYADLGGYLIDKNRLSDVHDILFRALKVEPTLPETNYNLARYFKKIKDYSQEGVALQRTLTDLQQATPLSQQRLGMLVDTYDRIGENLYREKRYLDAQAAYNKGISRYEAALKQNQLTPSAEFGKLYANLGDLNYYVSGKYDQALHLYQQAASNGYHPPELQYKEGYIHYRNQDYRTALLRFMSAAGSFSSNRDLLYATANTFFKRNDYSAAEGYYLNLLNMLETQRRQITDFQPSQIPAQHALLVDLMKVYNNLGVTLYELSKRASDSQKYSEGLVNLTHSMEAFDQLTRNPVTLTKSSAINLAFINTKHILYPTPGYNVQIYSDLPQDMSAKSY